MGACREAWPPHAARRVSCPRPTTDLGHCLPPATDLGRRRRTWSPRAAFAGGGAVCAATPEEEEEERVMHGTERKKAQGGRSKVDRLTKGPTCHMSPLSSHNQTRWPCGALPMGEIARKAEDGGQTGGGEELGRESRGLRWATSPAVRPVCCCDLVGAWWELVHWIQTGDGDELTAQNTSQTPPTALPFYAECAEPKPNSIFPLCSREAHMAPKRKPHGDGVGESPDEFANPLGGAAESSAEFTKPVFLVVVREDEQAPHSVLEIDAAATAAVAGNDQQPLRVRTVSALPDAERGTSFAAALSKHGSWIVCVGGFGGGRTIIFDPRTLETFPGPQLLCPKHKPVLISHGGEVYAISSRPRVAGTIDCEPWFESLSFNKGAPSKDSGIWFSWSDLPPPPFFPCLVTPYEFRYPPEISISSYAVVGSYILISPQPELMAGTHAFHVVNRTWEKVHDKNLPFVGQAVHLGGSLFAACPMSNNCVAASTSASVFNMSIKASSSASVPAVSTLSLSIKEFKVVTSDDKIPWPLFCTLGKGSFCCIRLAFTPDRGNRKAKHLKEAQVILTAFQVKNIEDIMAHCQSQGSNAKDLLLTVQVKEQSHSCKSKGLFGYLGPGMHVLAALSMDTETVELGDERTETRV